MWGQYTIIYFHVVTNKGGIWVLNLQQHSFQVFQLDYFHSQTNMMSFLSFNQPPPLCDMIKSCGWWCSKPEQLPHIS